MITDWGYRRITYVKKHFPLILADLRSIYTNRISVVVLGGQSNPMSMNQSIINQQINRLNFMIQAVVYLKLFITTSLLHKFAVLSDYSLGIVNTITSLVQAPLMLLLLMHFTSGDVLKRMIKKILAVLLTGSILTMTVLGTGENILLNIMLFGAFPVLVFSTMLLTAFLRKRINNKQEITNAVMLGAIVFAFGSYILLLSLNLADPAKHANDLRSIIGLITILSAAVISVSLVLSYQEVKQTNTPMFSSPASAGFAQWENFSLANTPDLMKNSVTDISKYYSGLQKTS